MLSTLRRWVRAACVRAAAVLVATALLASAPALAGPGHDHGHEGPAAPSGPALPRAVATSDLFELVAVLDGKTITIFIDRTATTEPVAGAKLELELAGQKLRAQPVNAAQAGAAGGDFTVTLPAELKEGVYPLTATVTAGNDIDLLAGEFDIHGAAHADEHAHDHALGGWLGELVAHGPGAWGWAGGGLLLAVAGALLWRRRSSNAARSGVVA
jgi:hypothetical protein